MIPYFDGHLFDIGPFHFTIGGRPFSFDTLPIHMFGVLVAIGVILGDRIVVKQGVRRGMEEKDVKFLNARIVIWGFLVAHWVSVIFYFPERIKQSPWILINFWAGLSSFGGFLGALLAFVYFTRKEKIAPLPYADSVALGLAVGWIFGRTGCFTAHDHPGAKTTFFLAVRYPDAAPLARHDLGFYELLFTIAMTAILFLYARKPRVPGRIIGLFATMYAPVRFCLDFLRARDVERPDERYFNLTPAQWACIFTLGVGVWLLTRKGEVRPFSEPAPAVPVPPAVEGQPSP